MMKKMGQEIGEVDCHLIIGFTDLVLRLFHSEKKNYILPVKRECKYNCQPVFTMVDVRKSTYASTRLVRRKKFRCLH